MATQEHTQLPDLPATVEIERLGFSWKYHPEYDITKVDASRPLQVREVDHYVPVDRMHQYAEQMKHTSFPPPLVTLDGVVIDGNTRVSARQLRDESIIPVIVVQVEWSDATPEREHIQNRLIALAATLNAQNGQPLTKQERYERVSAMLALDWSLDEISRALGLGKNDVGKVQRELNARERLSDVGLHADGAIHGSALRGLGSPKVLDLNDDPYRELAQLTIDAGLTNKEQFELTDEAKSAGSDAKAVTLIKSARKTMSDRIAEHKETGAGGPSQSQQFRTFGLSRILKYRDNPEQLVERNQAHKDEYIAALSEAAMILSQVLALQEKV